MPSVPMKPEYGPTLGRLLAPRWQAASRMTRVLVAAAGVGLLALLVGVVLTLENAHYSHGGTVAFSLSYRDLYRVPPQPGGYVRLTQRAPDGSLRYSYEVRPLQLPAYRGELAAELPLYTAAYDRVLAHRYRGFVSRGEGKTTVNSVFAYAVMYTALVEGRKMFGRDILLLPERPGVRSGVAIVMLTAPHISKQVRGPMEVGTSGVLKLPLRSFSFG